MARSAGRRSAGLLMYRVRTGGDHRAIEFYLAHPGGPFFAKKDEGVWTIPKGEFESREDPLDDAAALTRARREFEEEIGWPPPDTARTGYLDLGEITQKGGKVVRAFAFAAPANFDETQPILSNTFEMEWPPKSGRVRTFPEVDRAQFFDEHTARRKIKDTQIPLLARLIRQLATDEHR